MKRFLGILAVVIVAAVIVGIFLIGFWHRDELVMMKVRPAGIMGTECTLCVVARADQADIAEEALEAAEQALRRVESRMSVHLSASEVSRFNGAGKGKVALSVETMEVLRLAKAKAMVTGGAFDITCRPLLELWAQAAEEGKAPTPEQLARARSASTWYDLHLDDDGVIKGKDSVQIDLGGISKGYGIDKAIEAMRSHGVAGGLVDVGGDVRCFGKREEGRAWRVGVRNPFKPDAADLLAMLTVTDKAVCTSGNYFRFVQIAEGRYSHIIDPRPGPNMGMPADTIPSVTVLAPTAASADAWATALSVLGPEGLSLLQRDSGVEAMLVTGGPDDYQTHSTGGLAQFMAEMDRPED